MLPESLLAVRNPVVILDWSTNAYHDADLSQPPFSYAITMPDRARPAAELNTHTMIATVIFYIAVVGLLAYAAYLKHQLKK